MPFDEGGAALLLEACRTGWEWRGQGLYLLSHFARPLFFLKLLLLFLEIGPLYVTLAV